VDAALITWRAASKPLSRRKANCLSEQIGTPASNSSQRTTIRDKPRFHKSAPYGIFTRAPENQQRSFLLGAGLPIPSGLISLSRMTQAVTQLLEQFEHLSQTEQREIRRAIVERSPVSEDLTDEDFGALAAASFRELDKEEGTGGA
jgi:hypothetical protein